MNDNLQIEIILDDLVKNRIGRKAAEAALSSEGITDTAAQIDLHLAAAKAIQRFNTLKQVQAVHSIFNKESGSEAVKVQKAAVVKMQPAKWLLRVAAAAIFISAIFIGIEYLNTSSSSIYSTVYQPYEVNTSRGSNDIITHHMLEEFKSNNYQAVIKTYSSLAVTSNREKFLTACAYHETGQYSNAVMLLEQILQYNKSSNTRFYNDEAEYYLGLSYLKMKQTKKAVNYFERIAHNPDHTFNDRIRQWTLFKLKWLK